MTRLIDALRGNASTTAKSAKRGSFGPFQWPTQAVNYGGIGYGAHELITTTQGGSKVETIEADFASFMNALKQSPPAFAAQSVRAQLLSQARFKFRRRSDRTMFGTSALAPLEVPWPTGTTAELVSKLEWHSGIAGNAFAARVWDGAHRSFQIRPLRPDWVTIMLGSHFDPTEPANAYDAEVLGYGYKPGGFRSNSKLVTFSPEDVAHWAPLPDPETCFRGMAWIQPAVRELQGDIAMADHKLRYFENAATPNLVIAGLDARNATEFAELVDMMEGDHAGVRNAYKTLYLAGGADATVVGSDLKQIDFKATQGAGENRISVLSRVPAVILGISEGLAGSTLNAGNYAQSRRNLADGWLAPSLQSLSATLAPLIDVPSGAELWHDLDDMPFVREDSHDAALIEQVKASTIRSLMDTGFTAESVIAAVDGGDMTLLVHSGLLSVQLQQPGTTPAPAKSEPRSLRLARDEFGRPDRIIEESA